MPSASRRPMGKAGGVAGENTEMSVHRTWSSPSGRDGTPDIAPSLEMSQRLDVAHKQISDAVAYGLLVYTALQIFMTLHAISGNDNSFMPMIALVVLVAAIIPLYRRLERSWDATAATLAADPATLAERLPPAQRRARTVIWAISIGLPFAVTALIKGIAALV